MPELIMPDVQDSTSTADRCAACGHPTSQHDGISTRWCAATSLGVGDRACICSGVVSDARVLTHY